MGEEVMEKVMTSTPTSIESKSEDWRNSKGEMDSSSSSPDLKSKEKPVPRYLRACTGSCHDHCKYGTNHSFEYKKWRPVRPARRGSENIGNEDRDRSNILTQRGKPRKTDRRLKMCPVKDGKVIKPKKPPEKEFHLSDSSGSLEEFSAEASAPEMVETLPSDPTSPASINNMITCIDGGSPEEPVSIDLEMPSAIQDSDASDEPMYQPVVVKFPTSERSANVMLPAENMVNTTEHSSTDHMNKNCNISVDSIDTELADEADRMQVIQLSLVNRMSDDLVADDETVAASKKTVQAEPRAQSTRSSKESTTLEMKQTPAIDNITASSQKSRKPMHRRIADTVVEGSKKPKTVRKKADATGEFSSPIASVAPRIKEMKVSSPRNAIDSSAKSASSLKLKASVAKLPSPSLSSGNQTDRKIKAKNVTKNAQVWQKKGEEKVPSLLELSSSVNMSIKSISSIKMSALKKDKPAATLKNDKKVQRTDNAAADMKEKTSYMIEPKVQKPEVNNKENRSRKDTYQLETKDKGARRSKVAAVPSNDRMQSPHKLTFRRGKVVNLHSENNGPRLLRFRPAKVADENQRSKEVRGRITKKSDNAAAAADSVASEALVVVLRHQDVQDKKNAQGLFNNVIEETASKLVEARKSKVKALVGAFETVISLQESKAAP